jgi:hypothetical protein
MLPWMIRGRRMRYVVMKRTFPFSVMEAQIRYDVAASDAISKWITYDICFRSRFALWSATGTGHAGADQPQTFDP